MYTVSQEHALLECDTRRSILLSSKVEVSSDGIRSTQRLQITEADVWLRNILEGIAEKHGVHFGHVYIGSHVTTSPAFYVFAGDGLTEDEGDRRLRAAEQNYDQALVRLKNLMIDGDTPWTNRGVRGGVA